jgi:hypothetical protein
VELGQSAELVGMLSCFRITPLGGKMKGEKFPVKNLAKCPLGVNSNAAHLGNTRLSILNVISTDPFPAF